MSKKSRAKNKDRRDKENSARRAVNHAKYTALAGTASNRKKKHACGGDGQTRRHSHTSGHCGNPGCAKRLPSWKHRNR